MKYLNLLAGLFLVASCTNQSIDRKSLVTRNNIIHSSIDSLSSLTVGNGDFAFTCDITGLQTFPLEYAGGISLGTLSNWGWHSFLNVNNYHHEQVYKPFDVNGRTVTYIHKYSSSTDSLKAKASVWLRKNPHRIHLGLIGLEINLKDGSKAQLKDIQNPKQELNIWTGTISSYFEIEGVPVKVNTTCHPDMDLVSCKIESELLKTGQIKANITFPAPSPEWKNEYIFDKEDIHNTEVLEQKINNAVFKRTMDTTEYFAKVHGDFIEINQNSKHNFSLIPNNSSSFEISCLYSLDQTPEDLPGFAGTKQSSKEFWEKYWTEGGAVDFSACTDERAQELERRVVLSQYLMLVNDGGALPPQETGLTMNSWYGKFHLEMHWWHSAQFALWQRPEYLEKQMQFYFDIEHLAKARAVRQGYKGVRWPKMIGPDAIDSPSTVATYLIWQQPHPIWFAEALYLNSSVQKETLQKYKSIVYETADFMADFAWHDSTKGEFTLPPPIIPAQERFRPKTTINPAFELVYWHWGLKTAINWAERMGETPNENWVKVYEKLSGLTIENELYRFTEDADDSYTNDRYLTDHPMVLGCLGMMPPTQMVDRDVMQNTFDTVLAKWFWEDTWGWDFPLTAMCAAELGKSEQAIDALFMDIQTNTYLTNGHNYQEGRLPIYLPGNGALLTAVAKMCVNDQFPKNGEWNVKWENLMDIE